MGYMSPEQVRGLPVDHRSDIFSFGTILYEMLSGKRAFKRDTASDTIAAILKEDPPELTQSGRNISPALDHIVRHCLEKDRDRRFHSAHDIAFALSEASSPTTASGVQLAAPPASKKKVLLAVAAAVVVLAAVGVLLLRRPQRGGGGEAGGVKRVAVLPFENLGAPEDDYFADGIADADSRQADFPAGPPGHRARQLDALQEDDQDAAGDRPGARCPLPADGDGALAEGRRSQPRAGQPRAVEVRASGAPASRWQQPFDAAMTDVFQVQSDIATKVAQALGGALAAGEEKRLSDKPTQNLAAYDAFLKGEEAANGLARRRSAQPAQGARLLRAGRGAGSRLCAGVGESLVRQFAPVRQQHARLPALADRARQAGEKAVALAPNRPEGYVALGTYERLVARGPRRAPWSSTRRDCELRLAMPPSSAERRLPSGASGAGMRRWSTSDRRSASIPDPSTFCGASAKRFSGCDAIPRRGKSSTVPSPSRPPTSL